MNFGTQPPVQPPLGEETVFPSQPGIRPVPPVPVNPTPLSFDVDGPAVPGPVHNAVTRDNVSPVPPPIVTMTPQPLSVSDSDALDTVRDLQRATAAAVSGAANAVSKDELAQVLEGFARVLRGETPASTDVRLADHHAEVSQLKELLLEAQETIINLLNDRVFDRAKIAKLESEVRVLPDLQSQATRAMGLAMRTEEFQSELAQVRAEVERLRTSYVRNEKSSTGFFNWLLGRNQQP